MSVHYATILPMDNWFKYTYVCSVCDALVEITNKSNIYKPYICCDIDANWLSVVDATIIPTQKKEEQMDTIAELYNPNQIVTYKVIEGDTVTYPTVKVTHLEGEIEDYKQRIATLENYLERSNNQIANILSNLDEDNWYSDVISKEEVLESICTYLDFQPVKDISFTAVIRVEGRAEMPLGEDVQDFLDNLEFNVDTWNGDAIVENDSIESIEEN